MVPTDSSRSDASNPSRVREPQYFGRFRCIGADCADTCCAGWGVTVDRRTYEKYQSLPDHAVNGRPLGSLIEIHPASSSPEDYARFRLESGKCPALQEGLCAIQQTLGESSLPDLCSKYPRVLNVTGDALERSLHMSCPEAARLILSDPDAMIVHEYVEQSPEHRPGSLNLLSNDPRGHLYAARAALIESMRDRSLPLWRRIANLGPAIDRLAGVEIADAAPVLRDWLKNVERGSDAEAGPRNSTFQLETVLELVVARIGSDYTPARFLDCYRDFMHGLAWRPETTMEQLAARYDAADETYLRPFLRRYEHFFENYLISYVFRTVFPYCSRLPDRRFKIDSSRESMTHSYVLLAVHYAILRALLIGMAGRHQDALTIKQAIQLVQSYSKAFLHSTSFEAAAMEYLQKNVGDPATKVAALVMG